MFICVNTFRLKHLHNRKVRQIAVGMSGGKPIEGIEEEVVPKEADEEEDAEVESGNESEGTQPEEVRMCALESVIQIYFYNKF